VSDVRLWRVPSVHEIRLKDRKGSTAERTADAVAKANEDEAARAERDDHQTGRQMASAKINRLSWVKTITGK
jgi:hypothetical protein